MHLSFLVAVMLLELTGRGDGSLRLLSCIMPCHLTGGEAAGKELQVVLRYTAGNRYTNISVLAFSEGE